MRPEWRFRRSNGTDGLPPVLAKCASFYWPVSWAGLRRHVDRDLTHCSPRPSDALFTTATIYIDEEARASWKRRLPTGTPWAALAKLNHRDLFGVLIRGDQP